jgi:H+/Cl- antiporter ClcA
MYRGRGGGGGARPRPPPHGVTSVPARLREGYTVSEVSTTFARQPGFWRSIARSSLLGVLGALATLAFLGAEHWLQHLLWHGDEPATDWFQGPVRAVPIVLLGSLVVGLARRRTGLTAPDPNFVDELEHGRTDPRDAASLVGIGLVSLVSGASLGPEAPVATAGAGIGTAVSELSDDTTPDDVADGAFAGMAGVFGGLVTFPFAVPLIALEMHSHERFDSYRRLVPGLVSATVALAVLYPIIGAPFLGLFEVQAAPLASWHLAAGVLLGLVGAALGVVTAVVTGVVGRGLGRLSDPVGRAIVGGALLAGLTVALPLTAFSGREELQVVVDGGTALGVGLLVATLVGKMVTFAVSMRAGYFGGAILPLVFIGGVGGVLLQAAWSALPLMHAVAAVSAATATALVPLPLSLMILSLFMFATGVAAGAVPAVAVVTCYVAVHGTALLPALGRILARPPQASRPDGA